MTAEKESEIIEKYYNEIRNYIKSRMKDDDDFEAVTQETFIVFIRKLRTEIISSERGYLYFIAKAKIGDYYRQKNKILKHEDRDKDIYYYEKSRDSDNYDMDDEENILEYDFENDNTESIEENASIDEDKRPDDYPQNTMLRYASVCFQDYCTYSLSVRENVAFGNIANIRDDEDIFNAIDMSRLERTSFDNDIDRQVTKVFDTNGVVLSGGQSQKLSLARAFMYKHGLLVLDEPSASLDVVTENEIFDTTLNLMRDSTSIVITHRLANVIHCDRIVYLDSGKICEEGTHNELMIKKGKYAELFSIQAEKYILDGKNGNGSVNIAPL